MNRDDLTMHERKERVKWWLTAVAFLLIAVLFTGLCLQVFGKGRVKPSEWWSSLQEDEPSENDDMSSVKENTAGRLEVSDFHSFEPIDGVGTIFLLSSEAAPTSLAADVRQISVGFVPEETTVKEVTFSLAFQDPNSEWAKNKDVLSYVSISASLSSCEVRCLAPFAEPIRLVATYILNDSVRAECVLHYREKIASGKVTYETAEEGFPVKGTLPLKFEASLSDVYTRENSALHGHGEVSYKLVYSVDPAFISRLNQYGVTASVTSGSLNITGLEALGDGIGFQKELSVGLDFWRGLFGRTVFENDRDVVSLFRAMSLADSVLLASVTVSSGGDVLYSSRGTVPLDKTAFASFTSASSLTLPSEIEF